MSGSSLVFFSVVGRWMWVLGRKGLYEVVGFYLG